MTEIETVNKANLAHNTYRHIKVTISAMFTFVGAVLANAGP
jgi:hypothetical protein